MLAESHFLHYIGVASVPRAFNKRCTLIIKRPLKGERRENERTVSITAIYTVVELEYLGYNI